MIRRFDTATLPASPWKNGGGTTREIATWPPGADVDGFDWRVSIATIAASGPFSVFAGVDRTIMLLEGDGVRLQAQGIDHRLDRPQEPFAFSGDAALQCTLLGGASTDFNVMTRRSRHRADLRLMQAAAYVEAAPHGLLMSLRGDWLAGNEALAPGEGLWWTDAPHDWRLAPSSSDGRLACVRWWPRSETARTATSPKAATP